MILQQCVTSEIFFSSFSLPHTTFRQQTMALLPKLTDSVEKGRKWLEKAGIGAENEGSSQQQQQPSSKVILEETQKLDGTRIKRCIFLQPMATYKIWFRNNTEKSWLYFVEKSFFLLDFSLRIFFSSSLSRQLFKTRDICLGQESLGSTRAHFEMVPYFCSAGKSPFHPFHRQFFPIHERNFKKAFRNFLQKKLEKLRSHVEKSHAIISSIQNSMASKKKTFGISTS